MASIDNRSDRFFWGSGNLAGAVLCLPICWGLPAQDWGALKVVAAIGGAALGVNSVRLLSEHSDNAPIRAAWKESAVMVNAAWIEDMALANLPLQQRVSANDDYYPPQLLAPNFSLSAAEPATEQPPERGSDRKIPNLSAYPAVLIYGVPGSGKTTFATGEVSKRLNLGHKVIILDPHAPYGAWQGCEIAGGGMNYKAIEDKLQWLFKEIERRYARIQNEPNPVLEPLTVVAEEFTKWSMKVKSSSEFFWVANTDIRKAEVYILFVSHTRTLIGTGGAKGAASLRDESLIEVELQGEMNPETNKATPKFQALVKMPGTSQADRFLVPIERNYGSASTASPECERNLPPPQQENSGSSYGIRAEAQSGILSEILREPGKLVVFSATINLNDEEKLKIAKLVINQNLGIETTILALWGVKSGGRNHNLYVEAKSMLDRLMKEIS